MHFRRLTNLVLCYSHFTNNKKSVSITNDHSSPTTTHYQTIAFNVTTTHPLIAMPPKKKARKKNTPSNVGENEELSTTARPVGQKKTPPELLIAAAAAANVATPSNDAHPETTAGMGVTLELSPNKTGDGASAAPRASGGVTGPEAQARNTRHHALAHLLSFQRMYKQAQPKQDNIEVIDNTSSSDNENEEGDDVEEYPFDTALFDDETEDLEDLSYYRDEGGFTHGGRKLITGGPQKPDISNMGEMDAEAAMKVWRKERKKYTDGLALKKRKTQRLGDDITYDESSFTGVLGEKIRLMTQVEESPVRVGHTYPNKETVLIRIAEEANLSGCMISIGRSCSKRVIATGARDNHKFFIKVMYSNASSWKVEVCDTYPEPIPVAELKDNNNENNVKDDTAILGEQGNPDDDHDDEDDDDDNDSDDNKGGTGE